MFFIYNSQIQQVGASLAHRIGIATKRGNAASLMCSMQTLQLFDAL